MSEGQPKTPDCYTKLSDQLCFPLYAASKLVVKAYTPYLTPLGLTYTQYIAMLVLWEKGKISMAELGETLHLDSGTLTPMLEKMEKKGLIKKKADKVDRRKILLSLTKKGREMQEKAKNIPYLLSEQNQSLTLKQAKVLKLLLEKLIQSYED